MTLHTLDTDISKPEKFTYPFCYEPHPLCRLAADEVQRHIRESGLLPEDGGEGKMFGVLVVEYCEGTESGKPPHLGFLAAYSGLLAGRNDWQWFVPPVFDAQQPDGHFKRTETRISAINAEIESLRNSREYAEALETMHRHDAEAAATIEFLRRTAAEKKAQRDARRAEPRPITPEEATAMEHESQHIKAELRRVRKRMEARHTADEAPVKAVEARINTLKKQRHDMSDALQQWLFSQYRMLNARGEERDLCDIFHNTVHHTPPAGAGDCCAPKLLQYAYSNNLHPVCMAEFWWGGTPRTEIRRHLHYYPACRGKCLPILTHMMQGLDVDDNPLATDNGKQMEIIYEDEWLAVTVKPEGMLSVPGKEERSSVAELMRRHWGEEGTVLVAHRLDMDTSGLLLVARNAEIYTLLQRQFAQREVQKEYTALLDGVPRQPRHGTINLPLCPDIMDRPRQTVSHEHGKEAVTDYDIIATDGRHTLVKLTPHTGRTHQLRVHCAHNEGLDCPIHGDALYGQRAERLCLHAARITFTHPVTGKRMTFEDKAPFGMNGAESCPKLAENGTKGLF